MAKLDIKLVIPPAGSRSKISSLYRQLREAILGGRIPKGSQLPSSREFAKQFMVSRTTVITVYEKLQSEGYTYSCKGSGTFVTDQLAKLEQPAKAKLLHPPLAALAQTVLNHKPPAKILPAALDLRPGIPDISCFPWDIWKRLLTKNINTLRKNHADYLDPQGLETLRQATANHVALTRGVACTDKEIVITNGAQQAFDLLARALVSPNRTKVAVENPGYPGSTGSFSLAGAKIIPIPVDEQGICVDLIPRDVQCIVITPSHQFPTGVTLSQQRRNELIKLTEEIGAVIIEDDYDSEFRFVDRPLDALNTLATSERVIYVGTFSKSLFPMLRMGFVIAPSWLQPALINLRQANDWHGEALTQATLASFLSEGHQRRYARKMLHVYSQRREALLKAINSQFLDFLEPIPQIAGLHISANFLKPIVIESLIERAREKNLALDWLSRYQLGTKNKEGLIFGFGGCNVREIELSIDILATLI